ncbi:hypothetical protein BV25DRAFT_1917399 [Artomyces pyxidatus]|uniref:Uncharacterized protein n=1 Tax=Artomyces pyxidatus TaxID=48021 RepID=A0ACB8SWI4_9AGAM|nr:hypothetical protein BV25DRAFT_1917399 [Artomyces pyxidatus]
MPNHPSSVAPAIVMIGILVGVLLIALITIITHACLRRKSQPLSSGSRAPRSPTTPTYSLCSEKTPSDSQVSFTLAPNRPVFVDVESEGGTQVGLQLILTPPTPAKQQRYKRGEEI